MSQNSTLVLRGGDAKQDSCDRDMEKGCCGTGDAARSTLVMSCDALQALKEEERAVGGALRSLAKDLQVDNEAVSAFREVRALKQHGHRHGLAGQRWHV